MEAVTASMLVILIISGLGLVGASYSQCQNTLSSNGYNLTDSQLQSFYEAANDPDNIYYINTHSDSLSDDWSAITSGETDLSEWYSNYVIEAGGNSSGSISSVDSAWVEGGETQSVTVWTDDLLADAYLQQYGKPSKAISDGHGGYYQGAITSNNGSITYDIYHIDSNGGCLKLFSNTYPATVDYYHYNDFYIEELADGSQVCHYVQDIQFYENSDRFTRVSDSSVISFPDERTEEIEEKKTGEQTELTINPDGSITLPDGTLVYPNADGTYTINGTDYSPSVTVPDINDLLQQLLDLQDRVNDLENQLQLEKEKDNVIDSSVVDEAADSYTGDLSEFVLNSRVSQVFPFCLPFDLIRGFKLLSSDPVTPVFEIPINIPSIGAFPGVQVTFTLDFGKFSTLAFISRWFTTMEFIIGLTVLTGKVVKGASS